MVVNVGTAGSLGPAWPAGSARRIRSTSGAAAQIHSKVQSSSDGDFGYNSGWFGMILLSHPNWNDTGGAKPYRNSIDKLRTRCEDYSHQRADSRAGGGILFRRQRCGGQPGLRRVAGLENWDVCSSAMFLALYRIKTGDTTADAVVQTAAEAIAHRIQSWTQYDDNGASRQRARRGHRADGPRRGARRLLALQRGGALNIINAHALPALALLKNAGANMNLNLGLSINSQGLSTTRPLQLRRRSRRNSGSAGTT